MFIEIDKSKLDLIKELEDTFNKQNIIEDFNNNAFSRYFIYKENENILGFINYYDLYDRFEIAYIEVKEEYQNKKIGSKLMEHLIEKGNNQKIYNITLEVNINNVYAIKLYRKYDFVVVATREKYYDGVDGYLMERKMM